jgi:hypothetical protein
VKTLQRRSCCLLLGNPVWAYSKDGALYVVWQELLTLLMERVIGLGPVRKWNTKTRLPTGCIKIYELFHNFSRHTHKHTHRSKT